MVGHAIAARTELALISTKRLDEPAQGNVKIREKITNAALALDPGVLLAAWSLAAAVDRVRNSADCRQASIA